MKNNLKKFQLETTQLKSIKAGRRVYNGTTINCDTGKTESVWDLYNIFGNYKGQEVVQDQAVL